MGKKVSTNITIDSDIKAEAQMMLMDFGLDLSTAVNLFLRQMLREHAIPFEIRIDMPDAASNVVSDAKLHDEHIYGPFDSISELMEVLNAKI